MHKQTQIQPFDAIRLHMLGSSQIFLSHTDEKLGGSDSGAGLARGFVKN